MKTDLFPTEWPPRRDSFMRWLGATAISPRIRKSHNVKWQETGRAVPDTKEFPNHTRDTLNAPDTKAIGAVNERQCGKSRCKTTVSTGEQHACAIEHLEQRGDWSE